jgi:hypothetical protein
MDLYYPDQARADGLSREVLRIDAHNDETAMAEARRVDQWRTPAFYYLRAIRSAVRSGDRVIFDSRSDRAAPEESVIAVASSEIGSPAVGLEALSSIPARQA